MVYYRGETYHGKSITTGENPNTAGGFSIRTLTVIVISFKGIAIFVLDECVVRIDLLANRSTHWPVG